MNLVGNYEQMQPAKINLGLTDYGQLQQELDVSVRIDYNIQF